MAFISHISEVSHRWDSVVPPVWRKLCSAIFVLKLRMQQVLELWVTKFGHSGECKMYYTSLCQFRQPQQRSNFIKFRKRFPNCIRAEFSNYYNRENVKPLVAGNPCQLMGMDINAASTWNALLFTG